MEASYFEIYNEKIADLLTKTEGEPEYLKVREDKATGVFIEKLSHVAVDSYNDIAMLMDEGFANRSVQSTGMNAVSSRSHSIFEIKVWGLTQNQHLNGARR